MRYLLQATTDKASGKRRVRVEGLAGGGISTASFGARVASGVDTGRINSGLTGLSRPPDNRFHDQAIEIHSPSGCTPYARSRHADDRFLWNRLQ